jgi:Polyketide cyclase / dehydrase and lipid transport
VFLERVIEHRIAVAAPAATIFRLYEDVAHWHTWDPDTRTAWLDGPLQPGSRGQLTPTQGNTVPMLVTRVEANRSFTVESRIPLFRMVFDHELAPEGPATRVIHRVTLSGPLVMVLGPMLARRLNAGLPVTLARLKAQAEARASTA